MYVYIYVCVCMSESFCCTPESNATLQINYTSILKKWLKKKQYPEIGCKVYSALRKGDLDGNTEHTGLCQKPQII